MDSNIDDLKHIRSMMERSSKFLSLSGFSGVSAGLAALMGAFFAYLVMNGQLTILGVLLYDLSIIAAIVLFLAACGALFFSLQKAKKSGAKFWMPVTKQILKDFFIPMCVGGIFCVLLIYQNCSHMVPATMLIFYGLALIYAGARTYHDIKILGVCEIVLGLLAGFFINNGLLFWTVGFGLLHITYGIVMYFKYDKVNKNQNG